MNNSKQSRQNKDLRNLLKECLFEENIWFIIDGILVKAIVDIDQCDLALMQEAFWHTLDKFVLNLRKFLQRQD